MLNSPNRTLITFFSGGKAKRYAHGDLILRGEEPDAVYFLESGFVKVYSISDSGDKYIHIIYGKGEIFPLIWAIKNIKRRVFYEAISDVKVWAVTRDRFLIFSKSDAKIAYLVALQLAERFRVYADRLDNLQYKLANERIVYRLLFLASRFGKPKGKYTIIKAPLTHELIADSINLARETVSRELEKLEKDKLIGYHQRYLVLKDIKSLAKLFSEPITLDLWGLK